MVRVFLSAAEASGDQHGAHLLRELKTLTAVDARGVGGVRLVEAGLRPFARAEELSVMGLFEVVRHLPRLWRLARNVRRKALDFRPDVAVLIDSPDFHLPLARPLAKAGIPVVVYVSPQLWAWRPGRVKVMAKYVRKVLCILPFEVAFYREHGVDACFVGHPLVDELAGVADELPRSREHCLALLPGSRRHEVEELLPVMAEAFQILRAGDSALRAKVIVAPGMSAEELTRLAGKTEGVCFVEANRYRELASCAAALVASGTATLVCALLDVPMAVTYRLHPLSYAVAKRLVKVPHVGLVNLVAGERVAPELVQNALSASTLAETARHLLAEEGEIQRRKLSLVREKLGGPGASRRAAEEVLKVVAP
ncbi:MAG: lipid-A-disaccharide synthase [Thermoanaerobaculum sp.]